jgi:hypothetical protein
MVRLNKRERDQLVTNCHQFETLKHSTSLPLVFTEQKVARNFEADDWKHFATSTVVPVCPFGADLS